MKVISWNLKNIGQNKLYNATNLLVANALYGDNVLEFIANVVLGNNIWAGFNSAVPADLFVVIELKSGGSMKGQAVSGQAIPCLFDLVNELNNNAPAGYNYNYVNPLICGYHECVGIIYNTNALTYTGNAASLRNNNNQFINPRTPFMAEFRTPAPNNVFWWVTGIHAPPPQGGAAVRYRYPISFCTKLPTVPAIMGAPAGVYLVCGDFNCQQTDTWNNGGVNLHPFANASPPAPPNSTLTGYATILPANTLTSARKKLDNSAAGQNRYLGGAYDNILYKAAGPPNHQYAIDLIGPIANNVPGVGLQASLNNFWVVSDHLPVVLEE